MPNDEPMDAGLALWQAYCSEKERAADAEAENVRLRAENHELRKAIRTCLAEIGQVTKWIAERD